MELHLKYKYQPNPDHLQQRKPNPPHLILCKQPYTFHHSGALPSAATPPSMNFARLRNPFHALYESNKVLILWDLENCRIPRELWRRDWPTKLATRICEFFGRDRGFQHPEMVIAFRSLPPDAPFSDVLDELQSPGGFEILTFRPKFHEDGTAVKNHTADHVLKEKLSRWMLRNPEGGLVVFMTSDSDFLRDVNAVVENHNFRAELLFHGGQQMSKAPGMREKAHNCYEWMEWLQQEMRMPQLQMHPFDKELEWQSPVGSSGWGTGGGRGGRGSRGGGRATGWSSDNAGLGASGSGQQASNGAASYGSRLGGSGAAVLEVPRQPLSQPSQAAAAAGTAVAATGAATASTAANQAASGSSLGRGSQPFGAQAGGLQPFRGQIAGSQRFGAQFRGSHHFGGPLLPAGDGGGPVIASVQHTNERPKLIQLIHRQLTADDGAVKEFQELKLKLSRFKVLFNATSFASTGQVTLHRGSRQHLYAAKRLFEDFFRLIEAMNAKDDLVPLRPGQYSQQQLMYLEKCNSDKLRSIAGPFEVLVSFQFNKQQRFEMVARGKPFRMNDFMSSFEENFGQPSFVERIILVPCSTLCPVPLHNLPFPKALLEFAKGQLQFHGAEVQKDQDVLVLVSIVPRAEQTGPDPNIIRILIIGADPIPADASQAAMLGKVNAWRTELSSIPAGRQHMVRTFVADYTKQVKECHMAEIGPSTLAISCSSPEILNNATTALDQVLADVKPVTLTYKLEEKVGFLVRRGHWTSLVMAARADRVQMHYDPQSLTFSVAGARVNADRAMAKLQTVSAEVLQSSITLRVPLLSWQSPWFLDDCSKHAAKAALNRVASEQSVWWNLTSHGQQAMPDQSGLSGGSAARAEALIGVELNGRLVQAFKEDITKHACGAVVNAANSQLLNSGGVAEHICRAAGPGFQAMCDAVRAAQPQDMVEVGSCVVTSAAQLPCSKVIHAVGPNFFEGGTDDEPRLLRQAVTSALQAGVDQKLSSLALPLISSGNFGCPVDKAASIAMAAVFEFLLHLDAGSQYLQEIHFVDIGDAALLAIVASLKEQAGRLCVPVQENPKLGSILQQLRKSENGYGMRWGIHDNRIGKDITYSVEASRELEKQYQTFLTESTDHRKTSDNRYYNLIVAPHLSEQGMLYVVDLHLMKQENPITGKVHQAWRRNANGDSVAASAAANVTALQGSSSMSPHDQAGPSNSAAGTAPRVQETAETFLTLFGKKENCEAAQRAIEQQMETLKETRVLPVFLRDLSQAEQAKVAEACKQANVVLDIDMSLGYPTISFLGIVDRVRKAEQQVVNILLRAQMVQYPSVWEQVESQTENLQLYNVDPMSSEVAALVAEVEAHSNCKVLKVERIQNKVLYQSYDEQRRRITNRWANIEPDLQVVSRLWHGTSATDPSVIYDSEEGFSMLFSSAKGLWGQGTYFSTKFDFATSYAHRLTGSAAADCKPAGAGPVCQMLVADVLTGKSKMLPGDDNLKMPPAIEDVGLSRQLLGAKPRYDSVGGIHPAGNTPIYVTYTSAATSYPAYLMTYE